MEQYPLSGGDHELLVAYNAECARGIVHTPEWDERMAQVQADYDEEARREADRAARAVITQRQRRIGLRPIPAPDAHMSVPARRRAEDAAAREAGAEVTR